MKSLVFFSIRESCIPFCPFQIWIWMFLAAWTASSLGEETLMIDGLPCRMLLAKDKVLGMDGVGQILILFDLGSKLPNRLLKVYQRGNDVKGEHCLSNMTTSLNLTIGNFGRKVNQLMNEGRMTSLYLSDKKFIGDRQKRLDFGTLALLFSAFSFFISTTGLVVNGLRLNSVESRLQLMSQHIHDLKSKQQGIVNNLEYLYENDEFLGIERDLMIDYVNGIKEVHSCDYLRLFFDAL